MINSGRLSIQLKNVNRISVLNYIRRNRSSTKAKIAAESGLTFMAIQKIMEELAEIGLVREDALIGGYVGRKTTTYMIDEKYRFTLGLHINFFMTQAAVLNLHGEIVSYQAVEMADVPVESAEFIELLVALVEGVLAESKVPREKILGLGIGAPGPIHSAEGRILSPPNLPVLRFLPLKQIMENKLGLPVFLHKDTNAIAMGEYWRGAGAGYNSMVYVDADMGIGSGLILNGEMHEGANSVAGEFGHITIDPRGPLCNCGSKGCLEAMGSGISILKVIKEKLTEKAAHPLAGQSSTLTIKQVLRAGIDGDPLVLPVLRDAAQYMGIGLGNLINILDPEIIILGGILVQEYAPFFDIVKEMTLLKRLSGARENLIVPARHTNRAGVIGAGEIVAGNFFTSSVNEILAR